MNRQRRRVRDAAALDPAGGDIKRLRQSKSSTFTESLASACSPV
jgi:hypothetical protein